jgi:hypothetical protein
MTTTFGPGSKGTRKTGLDPAKGTAAPTRPWLSRAISIVVIVAACGGPPAPSSGIGPSRAPGATLAGSITSLAPATTTPTAAASRGAATPAPLSPSELEVAWLDPAESPHEASMLCSGSVDATDPVALVQLTSARAGELVMRDYADVANPRTVCRKGSFNAGFVDAAHIWLGDCIESACAMAIIDVRQGTYQWYATSSHINAVAPDLHALAWLQSGDDDTRTLHIANASGDQAIHTFPYPTGRCGSPLDSNNVAFSASGRYLFVLDQSFPNYNALLVVEGHDVVFKLLPPHEGWADAEYPLMALWSPVADELYYRFKGSVFRWTPATGAERVLMGVAWLSPSFTPDGNHLAWAVETPDGTHDVFVAGTADLTGAKLVGRNRSGPVFLNNQQLWYRSEATGGCAGPDSSKPLVYNLRSRAEFSSIVDLVWKIWPGTSATH